MPQTGRRPVPILPLPKLPDDPNTPVYLLKATGEIFLTYEAYSTRMEYLMTRIFQCEYSGKGGLDYFQALDSERNESKIVRERFPAELKGRVLRSIQYRVMGRIDSLIDQVFERFKERYFAGEKVFVDLGGDKYYARIATVFPPVAVRNLAREEMSIDAMSKGKGKAEDEEAMEIDELQRSPSPASVEDFTAFSHILGTDLNVTTQEAALRDDPNEYLYTVQLMDEDHKFEGSFMEVKAKALSRDRLSFSKSILKRYIRECVYRAPKVGSPWIVKPAIARAFGIPVRETEEETPTSDDLRDAKTGKKRKSGAEAEDGSAPKKSRKTKAERLAELAAIDPEAAARVERGEEKMPRAPKAPRAPTEPKKAIKYPIEDLDLDPLSIHDGRILRRVNTEIPPLPPKPATKRNLLVPTEAFDELITVWNVLNVFSKPLNLSPFSLDDFVGALNHSEPDVPCELLSEIHGTLTNLIGTEFPLNKSKKRNVPLVTVSAAPGTSSREHSTAPEPVDEELAEEEDELEDELEDDEGEDGQEGHLRVDSELSLLISQALTWSKRWDRNAKLKSSDGRAGWERHLIGCICSHEGWRTMPNFPRILAQIMEGVESVPTKPSFGSAKSTPVVDQSNGFANGPSSKNGSSSKAANGNAAASAPGSVAGGSSGEPFDPEAAYYSLPVADKLEILGFFTTLALGTKAVRAFVEEAETQLTEYRKQRADVNKERRALLDQKAVLLNDPKTNSSKPNETVTALGPPKTGDESTSIKAENGDAREDPSSPVPATSANGNRATSNPSSSRRNSPAPSARNASSSRKASLAAPESDMAVDESVNGGDDEDEDQLADDDELQPKLKGRGRLGSIASNADSTVASGPGINSAILDGHAAYRNRKLQEKQAYEKDREDELARIRHIATTGTEREKSRALNEVENALRQVDKKDDFVEREFRRHHFVSRVRPLGKDRFHCRYWWFDGVGSMDLLNKRGDGVLYHTGRLFVQGPSEQDYAWMVAKLGADDEPGDVDARRKREEVDEEAILGINEWGFYDDEEQLDTLMHWLNAKGTRELGLRNQLQKWSNYILAGARKRVAETTVAPSKVPESNSRRSKRVKEADDPSKNYLYWTNKLAKY